eukprot:m.4415 g.4415  ORF g.4415 m.4415 type:complete len:501 (+) comp10700_c0_seq1:23-1525(+)
MQSLFAFLLVLSPLRSLALNPGFRTEILEKGLDYVRQIGIPILINQLQGVSIPNQSGSASTPVGSIDYSLSNIKGSGLSIPTSSLTIVAGTGLQVSASGAAMHVTANWHYRESSWPHISDSGSCDVSVSSVSLNVVVTVGAASAGYPTISTKSCSFDIGHMDITFHGGASWLYNLFSDSISDALKGSIQGTVCSAAVSAINDQGNKALATVPVVEKLSSDSEINFALLQSPVFTSSYLQMLHKGEFFYTPHQSEAPFVPDPLPTSGASSSMMTVWLTDYLFNTAGYVYQEAGVLQGNITQKMIPSGAPLSLNTSSFKLIIPALYEKYPNKAMQILVSATSAPYVNTTTSYINLTAPCEVVAYVFTDEKTLVDVFTLGVTMHATVHVYLRQNGSKEIVCANATYLRSDISLIKSNIGTFKVIGLEFAVNALCELGLIPFLNQYGAVGFPIPVVDGITFVDPKLDLGNGYIQVSTDLKYTPSVLLSSEKHVQQPNYDMLSEI